MSTIILCTYMFPFFVVTYSIRDTLRLNCIHVDVSYFFHYLILVELQGNDACQQLFFVPTCFLSSWSRTIRDTQRLHDMKYGTIISLHILSYHDFYSLVTYMSTNSTNISILKLPPPHSRDVYFLMTVAG